MQIDHRRFVVFPADVAGGAAFPRSQVAGPSGVDWAGTGCERVPGVGCRTGHGDVGSLPARSWLLVRQERRPPGGRCAWLCGNYVCLLLVASCSARDTVSLASVSSVASQSPTPGATDVLLQASARDRRQRRALQLDSLPRRRRVACPGRALPCCSPASPNCSITGTQKHRIGLATSFSVPKVIVFITRGTNIR